MRLRKASSSDPMFPVSNFSLPIKRAKTMQSSLASAVMPSRITDSSVRGFQKCSAALNLNGRRAAATTNGMPVVDDGLKMQDNAP